MATNLILAFVLERLQQILTEADVDPTHLALEERSWQPHTLKRHVVVAIVQVVVAVGRADVTAGCTPRVAGVPRPDPRYTTPPLSPQSR